MMAAQNASTGMSNSASRIVLEYLRSRGYRRAEAALLEEHRTLSQGVLSTPTSEPIPNAEPSMQSKILTDSAVLDTDLALEDADVEDDLRNVIMILRSSPHSVAENNVRRYEESYCELRDWIDGSLDLYKAELHSVLYPVLVHCFLEIIRRERPSEAQAFLANCSEEFSADAAPTDSPGRTEEIMSLAGISSKQHLEENKTALLFLENRYELHLTSYAFELLISFLADDPRRAVLLRILNQRCRIRLDAQADNAVRSGLPGPARDEVESGGFISDADKTACIEKHSILWGRLTPSLYTIADDDSQVADSQADGLSSNTDEVGSATGRRDTGVTKSRSAPDSSALDGRKQGEKGDTSTKASTAKTSSAAGKKADEDDKEADGAGEQPHVRADGTISDSQIPLKIYRVGAQGLETEDDVKNRAALGIAKPSMEERGVPGDMSSSDRQSGPVGPPALGKDVAAVTLPSVLCYTFTNTRSDGLNCSAVSPDGSQIAAGFGDSSIRLWDAKGSGTVGSHTGGVGKQAVRLVGHSGAVYSVDWTNCARFVLSGSEDGTVRLWSSTAQADLVAYKGHNYPVWSVGFAPLGHYFASGSHDRSARIWVTDRVYPLRVLAGHLADVDVVRWHPNCNYVATGSSDRTARLWDLRDGSCVRVFGSHSGAVQTLAFAPDGRTLALAGEGKDIEVWDIVMGKRLTKFCGHTGTVWSMDFSREGAVLASGGADGTVRLWRAGNISRDSKPSVVDSVSSPVAKASSGAGASSSDAVGQTKQSVSYKRKILLGKRGRGGSGGVEMSDKAAALLVTLHTKKTPLHLVQFTRRNLLIAAGCYSG